jgi:protein CpxP
MNRFRLLVIGTMLTVALAVVAQQPTTKPEDKPSGVDVHLKFLSERLDLTTAQQAKLRPIIQEMQDDAEKIMQDDKLSAAERKDKMHACHDKADKNAREFLTDDQKKKLDQLEAEPHAEHHGN